jgi:hypothetical protein
MIKCKHEEYEYLEEDTFMGSCVKDNCITTIVIFKCGACNALGSTTTIHHICNIIWGREEE